MYLNNSFGKTIDLLHRSMSVNLLRQEVTANNIANANVPNFKRSTVNFETSLKEALDSEKETPFPNKTSSDRHIVFDKPVDYRSVKPRRITEWTNSSQQNGNNVDIEEETAIAVNSQLAYNMMVQAVTGEFNNVNLVLRG